MVLRSVITLIAAAASALFVGCGDGDSFNSALTVESVCGGGAQDGTNLKIVGGRECVTTNGSIVKLILLDEEDNQTICSGVRLNSTTILTAAHCLNEFVFSVSVELASGERVTPLKITLHPEATNLGSLFVNDLALLTILPPKGEAAPPTVEIAEEVKSGEILFILGYGSTNGASSAGSGVLRIGEMPVNEVTRDLIFSDYRPPTLSNTCFGDSGGPAFIQDNDGRLILAGITSTGTNIMCAVGDRSAFTNLTNQGTRDFIREEG